MGEPLEIGRVLTTSYKLSLSRLSLYFLIGFAVGIPTLVVELLNPHPPLPWGDAPADAVPPAEVAVLSPWIELPLILLGVILASAATTTVTHMMIADLRGTRFSLTEAVANGLRALLPLLGVLIVIMLIIIAIAVGALTVWTTIALGVAGDPKSPLGVLALPIFVVPMVIVWLMMSVVVPVIVVERAGVVQAMRRSAEMTKGHLWQLFWLFAVFTLIFFGVGVGFAGLAWALLGKAFLVSPAYTIASYAIGTLVGVFSWALIAVIYYYLRTASEGPPAHVASV